MRFLSVTRHSFDARRTQLFSWSLFLLVVLFLVSACGPGAENGAPKKQGPWSANPTSLKGLQNASFNPCTLFSKDKAGSVLGGQVSVMPDLVSPICRYSKSINNSAKGPKTAVNVATSHSELVVSVGMSEDARHYLTLDRASASSQSQVQNVSGVGDAAFLVAFTSGEALIVAKGNTILSLAVFYPELASTKLQSALTNVAKSAIQTITENVRPLAAPQPHPCALITANEASQILQRQPIEWFFTTNDAGSADCDYIAPQGMNHRVVIGLTTNAHAARTIYENAGRALRQDQKKDIKNLGDAAFYDGQNSIWVLKGAFVMHVTPFGASILDTSTIQLLHTAVNRL